MWKRFIAAAASVIALIVISIASASPASAASCWGDWCSGTDPQATGCSADATTFSWRYLPGTNYTVELRWSPTCKTQWTRISSGGFGAGDTVKAVQRDTGYTMSGIVGDNGIYKWTRQIYSPRLCVYSYWYKVNWGAAQTECV